MEHLSRLNTLNKECLFLELLIYKSTALVDLLRELRTEGKLKVDERRDQVKP
jgi:hypothetical protein